MSDRSVAHGTFVVERDYPVSPARAFAAFATPEEKMQWFGSPDETGQQANFSMDFRVGGRESNHGEFPDGTTYTFDATYCDIVPNERIVSSYDMTMNGSRISVSLATTEFQETAQGVRVVYTEHGAFLDGLDKPDIREGGTRELFDALGVYLNKEQASD